MLLWSGWALLSSLFHEDSSAALVYRLGAVYNACGIYFLVRIFTQSHKDIYGLLMVIALLMLPLAVEMLNEKATAHNLFSILGGVSESSPVRRGQIRAQGPFAHPILTGTVGAVNLPLMIGLWKRKRMIAIIGISACMIITIASGSSGPIMSAAAGIAFLFLWRFRHNMRLVRWLAFLSYIVLEIVMKAPAYFLLARIDISGGSTGWHRAELIQSAFRHINEWWFAGTDYTRHWMPTGVTWSPNHTDITNHYLGLGVLGGLPLILIFIGILTKGFFIVGDIIKQDVASKKDFQILIWTLGASLFAHAATFISVSYFDQSFVFIYTTLAVISSAGLLSKSTMVIR